MRANGFMIYFIINPLAGTGKATEAVPIIERQMCAAGAEHTFIYAGRPDDATRINGLIDLDKASAVVCVGGDGTVQDHIGMAIKHDLPFGVIPTGSANDLLYSMPETARTFASFKDMVTYYADKITLGSYRRIDAVSVNGDRYFLNIGGTGADINVLIDALPLKKYFGGGAYFISLIKNAILYKEEPITLTIDGERETAAYLLLAVCNGAYYGGRMRVAPPALIDDGLLTLCVIKKMPRLKRMVVFPLVKPGWHGKINEVSFINCSSVTLEFEGVKTINLDGNLSEFSGPLRFDVIKSAVRFII